MRCGRVVCVDKDVSDEVLEALDEAFEDLLAGRGVEWKPKKVVERS